MILRLASLVALARGAAGATYNVMDYGARGDGSVYDTAAVRAALAAAGAAGGGDVLLPAGKTFLSGSVNISAHTRLIVAGTLLGSPNSTGYELVQPLPWYGDDPSANPADPREWSPLVASFDADNVTITGGGVIDGNGAPWWACASALASPPCSGHVRPHGVRLLRGAGHAVFDVTIKNSPMWQLHLAGCSGVHVHDVSITAPPSTVKVGPSHNTDGVDVDCAQDVVIEDLYISTGDDIIAVKSGRDYAGRTFGRPSRNVTVRRLTAGAGHGLSIGSEMSAGVEDVLFEDIVVTGAGAGVRLKSQRGRGGAVSRVVYRNVTLLGVGTAVDVDLDYTAGLPPTNATATPAFYDVTLDGVTAVNPTAAGWLIRGLAESPLTNFTFANVAVQGAGTLVKTCEFIRDSACVNVTPSCPPCV